KVGKAEELFTSKFPFPLLITAAAYIDKYGPAERYNILKFTADLPFPAMFTYGSKELTHGGIAFAGMPDALMSLPNAHRQSVKVSTAQDSTRLRAEIIARCRSSSRPRDDRFVARRT